MKIPTLGLAIAAIDLTVGVAAIAATTPPVPPSDVAPPAPPAPPAPIVAIAPPSPPPPPASPVEDGRFSYHQHRGDKAEIAREVAQARIEAEQARREAQQVRAEAMREGAEARREAAEARREAMQEAQQARAEAMQAAEEGRRAAMEATRDIPRMVEASLARARADMAHDCARRGVVMPNTADFGALATCGQNQAQIVRASLTKARRALMSANGLTAAERARALAGIDQAISEVDHRH